MKYYLRSQLIGPERTKYRPPGILIPTRPNPVREREFMIKTLKLPLIIMAA
jgi:hypothetical protein